MSTPIASSDITWLFMDHDTNLMQIHGMLKFKHAPDWDAVTERVVSVVIPRYDVMRRHPKHEHGRWHWVDDPHFDLANHISLIELPDMSDDSLQEYLARRFEEPINRDHPLWAMDYLVAKGHQPGDPGAFILRVHHAMADGIRLVQLLLGLCDQDTDAIPPKVSWGYRGGRMGVVKKAAGTVADGLKDAAMGAAGTVPRALPAVPRVIGGMLNPINHPRYLMKAGKLARRPVRVTDALTNPTAPDNALTNSVRELSRLVLSNRPKNPVWAGGLGGNKNVEWVLDIDLDEIKVIRRAFGGTVNDVLLAVVALALTDYLRERHATEGARPAEEFDIRQVSWMLPVSLKPFDASLPESLGNHFAVVLLTMPLGISDPREVIAAMSERTTRLKHSAEPTVAFGFQWAIAESPAKMARAITTFFADKTVGQLSNVPGPRSQIRLAGAPVHQIVGWVPTTAKQPLGVCNFTYNGWATIGLSADTRRIPDLDRLAELLRRHMREMAEAAGARKPVGG
ncbi:MAG: DUF1298 domain-containing protein [Austwickia sp.]|nr:DUF1298 domain-containing protein [Austwickia sp.]MBK8437577.1 DUF1298 domain-containing protein [Austwickia sp.]MBK9102842.1 DUF1298 domain-containing protein [Austwickia sp.]